MQFLGEIQTALVAIKQRSYERMITTGNHQDCEEHHIIRHVIDLLEKQQKGIER